MKDTKTAINRVVDCAVALDKAISSLYDELDFGDGKELSCDEKDKFMREVSIGWSSFYHKFSPAIKGMISVVWEGELKEMAKHD